MSQEKCLNAGNLELHRGALYGQRLTRDRSGPRRHDPPDPRFDQDVASLYATWKGTAGEGAYASRAIANVAHHITHPTRVLDGHLQDAVDADVPLTRIEALGYLLVARARALFARKRKFTPAA